MLKRWLFSIQDNLDYYNILKKILLFTRINILKTADIVVIYRETPLTSISHFFHGKLNRYQYPTVEKEQYEIKYTKNFISQPIQLEYLKNKNKYFR